MTVAGASGSNYLVDSPVAAAVDALWPYSVTTQAGITILPNLTGNTGIPRTTTAQTGYWLSTEATQTTEGQPTLGQLVMTPKTCGAYVEVSRLLALQSDAEPFLRGHLMGVVGKLVDTAVLAGSGSSGQPQGLVNTAGIGTATGTSLNVAGLADLEDDVSAADGQNLQWITTPGVRKILRGRELATGSGAVWAADTVLGHPAHVSTAAPATTMICGDWSRCVLGLWGGITVEINPFAGFQSGVRGMRLLVALDVGFTTPAAFSIATSVT
jgi:HK97 family phage major capsid protein